MPSSREGEPAPPVEEEEVEVGEDAGRTVVSRDDGRRTGKKSSRSAHSPRERERGFCDRSRPRCIVGRAARPPEVALRVRESLSPATTSSAPLPAPSLGGGERDVGKGAERHSCGLLIGPGPAGG